jgi:hypothetical protein
MNGLNLSYILYLFGFVFFTCAGGFIQLKYVADAEEHTDEDDVFNEKWA